MPSLIIEGNEDRGFAVLVLDVLGFHEDVDFLFIEDPDRVAAPLEPPLGVIVRPQQGFEEGIGRIQDLDPDDFVRGLPLVELDESRKSRLEDMLQSPIGREQETARETNVVSFLSPLGPICPGQLIKMI